MSAARGRADPSALANEEQLAASDPRASALVSAHAGTGKTKLLIDRLLRLMLSGADPARIQCLTFTKAAAAEMAIRLQTRLGEWVTLDDATLDARLAELLVRPGTARDTSSPYAAPAPSRDMAPAIVPDTAPATSPATALRARARALFATVLDLPGGMRIGTIHAFCQSLLRRFPLEAQLSPHFRLLDGDAARVALDEAREATLLAPDAAALEVLAGLVGAQEFGTLVAALQGRRERLADALALAPQSLAEAVRRAAGAAHPDDASALAAASDWNDTGLREALRVIAERASPATREKAARMRGWLALPPPERAEHWEHWLDELFTAAGEPRAISRLVNPKLDAAEPWIAGVVLAELARVAEVEGGRRAIRLAQATTALLTLAGPVLRRHAGQKALAGQLEYDDLIARTAALLFDPGAAWVLYKLDGGLDHLLLDEVQDNSGAQWRIADALSAEFFAGEGADAPRRARPADAPRASEGPAEPDAPPRTVFAVGDRKQSIYSFQGAEPAEFDRYRALWRERVRGAGRTLREVTLDVSFRSAAPVLELVDAVFADPVAAAGVVDGPALGHVAHRVGAGGTVELWPLAPVPEADAAEPWAAPERNAGLLSAPQRLAEHLAAWIAAETAGGVPLAAHGRPLAPGDVLVLVRRRGEFARVLVRALKARGVPVAGLDRLVLTDQPAVQDLMALGDALLLPQDDLSVACVLTSPLGGLTDDGLMQLALGRRHSLWDTLRERAAERPDWAAAHAFLAALLARVDYASPHALLAEALGPLGGRARLFARLGPEAAEPVDELLGTALAYARETPPSLQGFLHHLRQSGAEVKREAEGSGGAVRIMTVHGAKGLQAPLVVLPDTTAMPPDEGRLAWTTDPLTGTVLPLWAPRRELTAPSVLALREAGRAERLREHNRLLYVALTRAEDRLVVCGWRTRRPVDEACWHSLVERGLQRLEAGTNTFGAWDGERLVHAAAQAAPAPAPAAVAAAAPPALPAWAGASPDWRATPPPAEPLPARPLAPSRPEGIELGPVPRAASPLDASGERFRGGLLVHALLQRLPALPPAEREAAALSEAAHALPDQPERAETLAREALAVMATPSLSPLFGPHGQAEQPLTGVVGTRVVSGQVDRLAVLPDRILVADFKTDRHPPARPEDTPVHYLRQMAAYRAVLGMIWPDRSVECLLVWTQGPVAMMLPGSLLDPHAPG